MFAQVAQLRARALQARYGARDTALKADAATVLAGIEAAKGEVYATGPAVHGARQHSRLDMLDQWENSVRAIMATA